MDSSDPSEDSLGGALLHGLLERSIADVATVSSGGRYVYVSPAALPVLGWEPSEILGHAVDDFIHPEDLPTVLLARTSVSSVLESSRGYVTTYRFRCKDGYVWTESGNRRVNDPRRPGEALVVASVREIADRKLVEVRLERQAITDPLTGIANRAVFMDRLTQALHRLERHRSILAVIYLDLDHFKVINDSLGHQFGDHLLTQVAERAAGMLRLDDTVARLGGDEFVILAEGLSDVAEATDLALRVCANIREPFDLDGEATCCTVSAGVSTTSDATHSAEGLLQEADLALYRAKERGRDRAEIFDEELRTTAIGRLGIEQMVRQAITDGRLVVHYQPVIDLTNGHVTSVEALVRIHGPDGLIFPEGFIDVAEEAGLIVPIDDWVLVEAVKQAKAWALDLEDTDFGGVAINVTARHLSNSYFSEHLADLLTDNDLPRGALSIEVTERILMQASNSSMDTVRTLRKLGVDIGLDDFGTGYSSLAYLRDFPLDFIKIDQSFIRKIDDPVQTAIVTAIIDLAHALGLTVIAEGVETVEQLRVLVHLGCDRGQGFLFGRSADAAALVPLIRERAASSEPELGSR